MSTTQPRRVAVAPASGAAGSALDGRLTAPVDVEPEQSRDAAARPVADFRFREQRSLWGHAWRQFRRHKLAMVGLVVFIAMVLATFVGSPLYWQEIDTIDFTVSSSAQMMRDRMPKISPRSTPSAEKCRSEARRA